LAFIFLMLLRIVVGYHFYKEGTAKLKSGTFTSKYFLSAAKGPLAPYFKSMLEDPDGMEQLCIKETKSDDGTSSFAIDTDQTFSIWNDFIDRTFDYYGLGSQELKQEIVQRGDAVLAEREKATATATRFRSGQPRSDRPTTTKSRGNSKGPPRSVAGLSFL